MPTSKDHLMAGIALRVAAATFFAFTALLTKLALERGVSVPEMLFYRNAFALPMIAAWLLAGPGWQAVKTSRPFLHLSRSLLGTGATLGTFATLALLPLAEATTLTYTAPIIATLLSALLLGEVIGWRRILPLAGGIAGVVLVANPSGVDLPLLGIATGLVGASLQALVMTTVRRMGETESVASIVFWFTVVTSLIGLVFVLFIGRWHGFETLVIMAGCGITGGCGQLAMTASLRFAPVSVVVPFDYLQIIWAVILGLLVFGSPVLLTTIAGAALIAACGMFVAYSERQRSNATAAVRPPAND